MAKILRRTIDKLMVFALEHGDSIETIDRKVDALQTKLVELKDKATSDDNKYKIELARLKVRQAAEINPENAYRIGTDFLTNKPQYTNIVSTYEQARERVTESYQTALTEISDATVLAGLYVEDTVDKAKKVVGTARDSVSRTTGNALTGAKKFLRNKVGM